MSEVTMADLRKIGPEKMKEILEGAREFLGGATLDVRAEDLGEETPTQETEEDAFSE